MELYFSRFNNILLLIILSFAPVKSVQPRSVNLALETSFLFDPQDIKENATFLYSVQNVIDKLKSIVSPNSPVFRHQTKEDLLTKFLTEVGRSLIKFDDADIRKFVNDFIEVLTKEINRNVIFNEMIEDERMKSFIKNYIKEWTNTDPMKLKLEIAKYIINDDTNPIVSFFRVLNKFFDETDEAKFNKLLKKLTKAKNSKNFSKFLSKSLEVVVFQRYKNLNFLLKQIWKQELKKLTDYLSLEYKSRTRGESIETPNYRRLSLSNLAKSETFSESSRESFFTSESIEISRTGTPIQNNAENEIVINKDLQMDVRTDGHVISVI